MSTRHPVLLPFCLFATWVIWGSTYLGIKFALHDFPPYILSGTRYLLAGSLLLAFVRWRGEVWPSRRQVANAALIGLLMLTLGNGLTCVAVQSLPSGATALIVAVTPLLTVLLGLGLGNKVQPLEWGGIALGLAGIVLMNRDASLAGHPAGVLLVLGACVAWATASVLIPRLDLPSGAMSSAVQMLAGGMVSLPAALLMGERMHVWPSPSALMALLYLVLFGSIVAYSAFVWLLRHVRPALATSSSYVNPVVALALGWLVLAEPLSPPLLAAAAVILAGVALIGWASARRQQAD
ncbi:drug/metabolite exporter YedA [Chitinimonas sp.]|uniref:drug/metabolite exporter YedA n=1 Tax=Chitinimonas sp. TaxID=1934313 RepID=UPI002F921406